MKTFEQVNGFSEPVRKGWACPKCKAVISPYTTSCPHCMPIVREDVSNVQLLQEIAPNGDYYKD